MNKQYIMDWLKAAGIRALKTFCQTFLASASVTFATTLKDVNWIVALSSSTLAAILSILTSIGGIPEVNKEDYQETIIDDMEDE